MQQYPEQSGLILGKKSGSMLEVVFTLAWELMGRLSGAPWAHLCFYRTHYHSV